MSRRPIALLSVYNKDGIVEFAQELVNLGFDLISSGGTADTLSTAKVPVKDVAEISGLPAVLGHRVVTLVPHIHGGLLATEDMRQELNDLGYPWIDLVCVDLYPLHEEIAKPNATRESVLERTDIGGPTMLRSGAKGRRIVVSDPADRMKVIGWLKEGKPEADAFVTKLVAKAEGIIARYCLASARYHSDGDIDGIIGEKVLSCKYGENAWQTPAALYSTGSDDPLALDKFTVVAGQPPSYNNLCDLDRQLQTITHMAAGLRWMVLGALAVKHGNPCGAGVEVNSQLPPEPEEYPMVLKKMIDGDTRAIFGGLVMTTFEIDEELAEILLTYNSPGRRLLDGIVAPGFTSEAIQMLKRKEDKCRFIMNAALKNLSADSLDRANRFRFMRGAFLKQPNYTFVPSEEMFRYTQPGLAETPLLNDNFTDAMLAWAIGSTSNSNTITLVKNGQLIGNGVGQQDRVGCCELALKRAHDAKHDAKGSIAYSDSFFPFPDGTNALVEAGVRAIFTTSGSVRDGETKGACEKGGVALYMLPDAEARGFFGH